MKTTQKRFSAVISAALVLAILMVSISAVIAAEDVSLMALPKVPKTVSVHENIDITEITGEVVEPPMLTSAASSIAREKEWYEYVYYSPEPVAYFYVDEGTRVSFYDPYDYASSLIMEVDDSITDWSSNNSMQVSYTTGNSIVNTSGSSSETVTTTHYGYEDKQTTKTSASIVETVVSNRTDSYNTSKTTSKTEDNSVHWGLNESATTGVVTTVGTNFSVEASAEGGAVGLLTGVSGSASTGGSTDVSTEVSGTVGGSQSWVSGEVIQTTEIESTIKDGEYKGSTGHTISKDKTTVTTGPQTTTITNTIADRTTKATGGASNTSISLSADNSTTVTKTYEAGYFNAMGAPLQWKIIKYTVKMPMFLQVEYLIDGEWVFGDSNYCTLNTIQGTCRAWLQNNTAYYEHWGTGEPVTWDEFWSQFFTEDQLIAAYKNRLYPDF